MKKPSLLVIFLTVFISLVGFGIVIPLLPLYGRDFGASGFMIGLIMASYSAMQFLFAPVWGRLSDRMGRKPVLIFSLMGSVLSYVAFAYGSMQSGNTALTILLVSRVLAGIFGGNITVAQAYIADITPPDKRSKGMGLIGMAFGLGFIFGPVIGSQSHAWFGMMGPGIVAAGFCFASLIVALAWLKESWKPQSTPSERQPALQQWKAVLSRPNIGLLIAVFFLATFGFTCFETTLGLLLGERFGYDRDQDKHLIGYLFAYCGLIGAYVQGRGIGKLVRRFGEPKLIGASLVIFAVSMCWLPFIHAGGAMAWFSLFAALALLAIGSSMTRPPVFGLISRLTPEDQQGVVMGVATSAGSLARIVGPLFAATTFQMSPAIPYQVCALVALVTGVYAWVTLGKRGLEMKKGEGTLQKGEEAASPN